MKWNQGFECLGVGCHPLKSSLKFLQHVIQYWQKKVMDPTFHSEPLGGAGKFDDVDSLHDFIQGKSFSLIERRRGLHSSDSLDGRFVEPDHESEGLSRSCDRTGLHNFQRNC